MLGSVAVTGVAPCPARAFLAGWFWLDATDAESNEAFVAVTVGGCACALRCRVAIMAIRWDWMLLVTR